MKLTDFAIIFAIILTGVMYTMEVNNYNIKTRLISNQEINLIMDESIVDSLDTAFGEVDSEGNPVVELNKLSGSLLSFMSLGLSGNDNAQIRQIIEGRIMFIIYTGENGFYCYKEGKWSDIILYNEESHESQIIQIESYIDNIMNKKYISMIPYNDGEDYKNSIHKYSAIAFYESVDGKYCFSGAKIQLNEEM